jgi:hypothetical protein
MTPDDQTQPADDDNEVTPLPIRNAMHYDGGVFERVDWTHGAAHMQANHGITPEVANEALGDPDRVVIAPDYNSRSGQSVRIIGFSTTADEVITVIVVVDDGVAFGANGWASNAKDRRIYNEGSSAAEEGEVDGQGF